MRFSSLAFALLFAAGCSTAPPPAPAPPPRLIDQLRRIEMVPAGGYAFSHDGRALIFSAEVGGTVKAFSVTVSGADPTALTDSADAHVVSYFPADDRILLRVGDHLVVRERDETTRDLGIRQFVGWCSDGSPMVHAGSFVSRLDATSYVEQPDFWIPEPAIHEYDFQAVSRDCQRVAMTSRRSGSVSVANAFRPNVRGETDMLADSGETIINAAQGLAVHVFGFTPSSQSLIYARSESNGFVAAYRYSFADRQNYLVMQTQADVMAIEFSPTGRYGAYYSGTNGAITDTAVVDQNSDTAVPLSGSTRDLRFSRDETRIAFRLANDGWPNDIFVSDLDGGHITRLVHAPNAH